MNRYQKFFIYCAGFIFFATGIAKVTSALGNTEVLAVYDPIFGIKFGNLMLFAGGVELILSMICFAAKNVVFAIGAVAFFSTTLAIYRLGLWWIGWRRPCVCLGNLTDEIHISPQIADNISIIILFFLTIFSYQQLFVALFHNSKHELTNR